MTQIEIIVCVIDDQECNPSRVDFGQCKANETCIVLGEKAVCKCKKDFVKSDSGVCEPVPNEPSPSPAHNTAESSDAGGFGKFSFYTETEEFFLILILWWSQDLCQF